MKLLQPIKLITNAFVFSLLFLNILDAKSSIEEKEMSSTVNYDICNLNLIYNTNYQYSLPQKVLEGFLSGKAFDNPSTYTPDESKRLHEDIKDLYQGIIGANPIKDKLAIMTAGAPGAGKTVKLRQELEAAMRDGRNYAYICPDDVCLQGQTRTYKSEIDNGDKEAKSKTDEELKDARQTAYNKWRPGSNAATHLILGNLIREKYAFYFGTTSSGPVTFKFFEFLKTQGYRIRLIHVSASDEVRWGSIKERDKTFVQTTEQDVKEKGLLLPQRISDTFLKYADEIEFYHRDDVNQNAILAARWLRNENNEKSLGTLQVIAPDQYKKIKAIHNEAAKTLLRPDLFWEKTVEHCSQMSKDKGNTKVDASATDKGDAKGT